MREKQKQHFTEQLRNLQERLLDHDDDLILGMKKGSKISCICPLLERKDQDTRLISAQ